MHPSKLFILAWLLAAVAWDLLILLARGREHTISAVVLDWSYRWPLLPLAVAFGAGVLAGHLFWPQQR